MPFFRPGRQLVLFYLTYHTLFLFTLHMYSILRFGTEQIGGFVFTFIIFLPLTAIPALCYTAARIITWRIAVRAPFLVQLLIAAPLIAVTMHAAAGEWLTTLFSVLVLVPAMLLTRFIVTAWIGDATDATL